MNTLRTWLRRLRRSVRALSGRRRAALAGLVLAAVVGAVWLIVSVGGTRWAPLLGHGVEAGSVTAVRVFLDQQGVRYRCEGEAILVPTDRAAELRRRLHQQGLLGQTPAGRFEQLAAEPDLWLGRDQRQRRWLAAKMSTLSALIARMEPVRTATVLLEPGSPRRIGHAGASASAAVNLQIRPDRSLNAEQVEAIADMVTASVAGMERDAVRIVDQNGRRYLPLPDGSPLAELAGAESHYRSRVERALSDLDGLIVGVDAARRDGEVRCRSVTVALPAELQSGLDAAARDSLIARVRRTASSVTGASPDLVQTEWYAPAPHARAAEETGSNRAILWAGVALGGLVGLVALGGVQMLRKRGEAPTTPAESDVPPSGARRFGFLSDLSDDDLAELLAREHPQTIAVTAAHVDEARAAAVLAALPADHQAEVARRIAAFDETDEELLDEIEQMLAARLSPRAATPVARGGSETVARILNHAGSSTRRDLLQTLGAEEPALAEAIRSRMFGFADLLEMPADRLREALAALDEDDLAIALRAATPALTEKLLDALPARRTKQVRQRMQKMGPVRLSDVEAAQEHVAELVRRFVEGEYYAVADEPTRQVVA